MRIPTNKLQGGEDRLSRARGLSLAPVSLLPYDQNESSRHLQGTVIN